MPRVKRFHLPNGEPIGRRLARLRKERDLTQVELARRLNIPQSVLCDYERGHLRLNAEVLAHIARILGVSADEILGLRQGAHPRPPVSPRWSGLWKEIDRLSATDRQALFRTIQNFLSGAPRRAQG